VIIQPTCYKLMILNEIRRFFRICRLLSRHAITPSCKRRYVVFSGYADYSADMRNANGCINLWQILRSDYAADMRNSIQHKEMWPSGLFLLRPRPVRAPLQGIGGGWTARTSFCVARGIVDRSSFNVHQPSCPDTTPGLQCKLRRRAEPCTGCSVVRPGAGADRSTQRRLAES
jgi:hypothetical protein